MFASLFTGDTLVMVPSTAIVVFVNLRYALAARLLHNLRRYFLPDLAGVTKAINQGAKRVKVRRGAKRPPSEEADGLLVAPFTYTEVIETRYFGQLEVMLYLVQLCLVSFTLTELLPGVFARNSEGINALPITLAVATAAAATASMLRVDLLGQHTSREDRLLTLGFGAGALAAVVGVLVKRPTWSPARHLTEAAAALSPALEELLATSFPSIAGRFSLPDIPLGALAGALAAVSLTLALATFLPTLRFVLSFKLHRSVPDWATNQIPASAGSIALMTVQFVGPLAVSMLWGRLRPRDVASMPVDEERRLQGAALLTLATVHILNARVVLQRYLDSALVAWYRLRNPEGTGEDAPGPAAPPPRIVEQIVRTRISVVNGLVGKAAVEAVAPAVILAALAVPILWAGFHSDLQTDADWPALIDSVVGFLAWWYCTLTFLFNSAHMWLFRASL